MKICIENGLSARNWLQIDAEHESTALLTKLFPNFNPATASFLKRKINRCHEVFTF